MKLRTFILLFILFAFNASALGGNDTPSGSLQTKVKLLSKKIRPNDVGHIGNNVECYYLNGVIYVEFEHSEGMATIDVTRLDDGVNVSDTFQTSAPYAFQLGNTPGCYQIELSTSEDNYIGFLDL